MPKVSVVLPVFNGTRFLREAITSVLDQRFKDFELIAVDDGSTDGSAAILSEYPQIRVLTQKNAGQSSARNRGISVASGEMIALIDQDDRWHPTKLSRQIDALDAMPHVGMHYSDMDAIDERGNLETRRIIAAARLEHPKRSIVDCLRQDMFIIPTAVMFRRRIFDQVGGFDERLSGYEDDDLFLRMFPLTCFEFCPESLVQWRTYSSSYSHSERMERSRRIYIKKLVELFPDNPARQLYFVRDLIVPRFTSIFLDAFNRARHRSEKLKMERIGDDLLNTLGPYMTWRQRNRAWLLTRPGRWFALIRWLGNRLPRSVRELVGSG
jgi:glycosyltransferase involved in cell wall biosynthesis